MDSEEWGKRLGQNFARGMQRQYADVARVSRQLAMSARYHQLKAESDRVRRYVAMPWYRRWWTMVRGR